jgi:MATE family multidrug resistance protein
LGPASLAGAGLGNSLFFLATILPLGLMMGIDPLASQAVGAGRPEQARRHLRETVRVGLGITAPAVALCFALTAAALPALGTDADTTAACYRYLAGRAPSVAPLLVFFAQRGYLQATGNVRPVWISALVANVINVPLASLMAFGDRALTAVGLPAVGFEGLGVLGAGLGTSVAALVQAVVLHVAVRGVQAGHERATWAGVRTLLRVGLPIGVHFLAEAGLFCTVSLLMARFGDAAVGGHQVALQIASLSFTVCLGLGAATATRVGQAVGRGDAPGTRRAGLSGLFGAASFMSCCAVVFALAARPLASLIAPAPEVIAAAVPLVHMAAVFQVFDGTQVVAGSALRGAADTRAAMLIGVIGHWGMGFGLAMALGFGAGWGPVGLWWGLTLGLAAAATALTLRFEWLSRRPVAAVSAAEG